MYAGHTSCLHHERQRLAWSSLPGINQSPPGAHSMSERCFNICCSAQNYTWSDCSAIYKVFTEIHSRNSHDSNLQLFACLANRPVPTDSNSRAYLGRDSDRISATILILCVGTEKSRLLVRF